MNETYSQELAEFLDRDGGHAPVGFFMRMSNACAYETPPITTVAQLRKITHAEWMRFPNIGKKSVDHLFHLLSNYAADYPQDMPDPPPMLVHKPCKWCGGDHAGFCPRVKVIEFFESGDIKRVEFKE